MACCSVLQPWHHPPPSYCQYSAMCENRVNIKLSLKTEDLCSKWGMWGKSCSRLRELRNISAQPIRSPEMKQQHLSSFLDCCDLSPPQPPYFSSHTTSSRTYPTCHTSPGELYVQYCIYLNWLMCNVQQNGCFGQKFTKTSKYLMDEERP